MKTVCVAVTTRYFKTTVLKARQVRSLLRKKASAGINPGTLTNPILFLLLQHMPFEAVTVIAFSFVGGEGMECKMEENETEKGLALRECATAPELEHPKSLK